MSTRSQTCDLPASASWLVGMHMCTTTLTHRHFHKMAPKQTSKAGRGTALGTALSQRPGQILLLGLKALVSYHRGVCAMCLTTPWNLSHPEVFESMTVPGYTTVICLTDGVRQGGGPTWSGNVKATPQSSSTHNSSLFIFLVSSVSLKFWKTNRSNEARDVSGQRIIGHPGLSLYFG